MLQSSVHIDVTQFAPIPGHRETMLAFMTNGVSIGVRRTESYVP